jgi:hypothetical protein
MEGANRRDKPMNDQMIGRMRKEIKESNGTKK